MRKVIAELEEALEGLATINNLWLVLLWLLVQLIVPACMQDFPNRTRKREQVRAGWWC
jgi:hypothetical protein